MKKILKISMLLLAAGLVLGLAGCDVAEEGDEVYFSSVTQGGGYAEGDAPTRYLTLSFDSIINLSRDEIILSGMNVNKGELVKGFGTTYLLYITNYYSSGYLTVEVATDSYIITSARRTVYIYGWGYTVNDTVENIDVTLNSVTANSAQPTSQLTLNFSQVITGLSASDISISGVTGVSKGTLSGSGPTYTLGISGVTIGGTLVVSVAKSGYNINGALQSVDISGSAGTAATGLYMGVIGFNDQLTEKTITQLNTQSKGQFQTTINNMAMRQGTGLYYAVDQAIDKLVAANLPNDVGNVSLITFTDGLDNVSTMLDESYDTVEDYRDALKTRITTVKIKNQSITAYSVGMKGNDVTDNAGFTAGLTALASNATNVYQVADMTAVNTTFREIANSLYKTQTTQNIKVKIPGGVNTGTKIRFTFDVDSTATSPSASAIYIEGIYDKPSRSLGSVTYHGLTSSSTASVTGVASGVFVTFTFADVASSSTIDVTKIKQWNQAASSATWQVNSEFGKDGDIETVVVRKSAVIMLVLDCTDSLGTASFASMKTAANNFIDVLYDGSNN